MIWRFYEKHLKFLMWFPVIFLVASAAVLAHNLLSSGSVIPRGTELVGGKSIIVPVKDVDLSKVESALPYAAVRLSSGARKSLLVEVPIEKNETEVISDLSRVVKFDGEPSIRIVGPVLADIFFQQTQIAILVAFAMMAAVIFVLFRSVVPSSIVILAATTDIVGTMAVIGIIGIKLSLPVLAALLTLIGYSVDTDILLTTELLKGDNKASGENIRRAVKTGLTLTSTTLAALAALYLISGSFVLEEIAVVLIVGLLIDMPATWFTNAGLLKRWVEKRAGD